MCMTLSYFNMTSLENFQAVFSIKIKKPFSLFVCAGKRFIPVSFDFLKNGFLFFIYGVSD